MCDLGKINNGAQVCRQLTHQRRLRLEGTMALIWSAGGPHSENSMVSKSKLAAARFDYCASAAPTS